MRRWMTGVGIVALCLAVVGPVWAGEPSLDAATKELATWTYGKSRAPKVAIGDLIRGSRNNEAERKKIIGALVGLIKAKESTVECKAFCCDQLSIIGDAAVVPVLATLLPDAKLSHHARIGLERIPGDEASAALRAFLPKATGKLLVGAVNSLGERRDPKAVPALVKLIGSKDAEVAAAAAIALGKIGGTDATAALKKAKNTADPKVLRSVVVGAYLRCGDHLVAAGEGAHAWVIYEELYQPKETRAIRVAALRGLVNADRTKATPLVCKALTGDDAFMQAVATEFVREGKETAETKAYVALLPKLTPAAQSLLIGALADRGDKAALPAMVAAAKGKDAAVRAIALTALGSLGDASVVPMLAEIAAKGDKAAAASLNRVSGPGVDEAILKALSGGDTATRIVAIRSAAARRLRAAVPALLKSAKDSDASIRTESLRALGVLADAKALPTLVALLVAAPAGGEQRTAEEAVKSVAGQIADPAARVAPMLAAMPKANVSAKCSLLRLMGRVGGGPALNATRSALKDADPKIREAALRALADWVDPSPAADLMGIVKTPGGDAKTKILAFRGVCKLAGLRAAQSVGDGLKMYEDAMKIAPRPEEKTLVLSGIGNIRHPAALKAALKYLDDPALKAQAAAAVKKIAGAIRRGNRKEADAALKAVQEAMKKK